MDYYTYLLCCWKTKSGFKRHRPLYGHIIYCGQTYNIFKRLLEHIKGKSNYTRQFRGLIRLGYLETHKTRKEAMNRESKIKRFSRDQKIKMIYNFQTTSPEVIDYVKNNIEIILNENEHKITEKDLKKLNAWERKFLESVDRFLESGIPLTDKQLKKLQQIDDKLCKT